MMAGKNIAGRLATAIRDIFDARVRIEMTVSGDREEQLRLIREERERLSRPVTVTRAEMAARTGAEEPVRSPEAGKEMTGMLPVP